MSDNSDIVQNRHEILFGYDAESCNPNGNPMSADDKPRINNSTGRCIVTDVRLKRYIRDQLDEDGYGVYVKLLDDEHVSREGLFEDVIPTDEMQAALDDEGSDDDPVDLFLDSAIDVRLFGATMSISDTDLADAFMGVSPGSFTGPLQFSPAKSLNAPVKTNTEYNSLTSVIATGDDKDGGGFDLSDNRIEYGFFPFHGVVNENAAETTNLRQSDVELLDSTIWRALRNQTLTRSKVGQSPRFYFRVEYESGYHRGDLARLLDADEERSAPPEELEHADQFSIDMTRFVSELSGDVDHIETVHAHGLDYLPYTLDGESVDFSDVLDALEANDIDVNRIDPYN